MPNNYSTNKETLNSTEKNLNSQNVLDKAKLQGQIYEKFEHWREISKYLDKEKSQEIDLIISNIDSELQNILLNDELILTQDEIVKFEAELSEIGENIESQILENKEKILQESERNYDSKIEKFNETLKQTRLKLKENLLNSIPQNVLNKDIGENMKIKDIISKEIDENLQGLGSEVKNIKNLINQTKTESNVKRIIVNLQELEQSQSSMDLSPSDYLKSLYSWNPKAEISSSIVSDLNEYVLSLNFFFSDKGIEEKIGMEVPKTAEYNNTNKLIKDREIQILDRFSGDAKFVKKYKKLSVHDMVKLRMDWENEIMCQYIADTLNKDNITFKVKEKEKEKSYDKDTVLMLTNWENRKDSKQYKKLFGNMDRSADTAYLSIQKQFYDSIYSHPDLKNKFAINLYAEQSGDKNKVSVDETFIKTSQKLVELNYLDDPRLLNYKELIDELSEMSNLEEYSKEKQSKRIEFANKYRNEIVAPEGLGNLLYAVNRLFKTYPPERLNEMKENGEISVELINNNRLRKGDKYKEGRAFFMTKKSFDSRQQINADKMAFVDATTYTSKSRIDADKTIKNNKFISPSLITARIETSSIQNTDFNIANLTKDDSFWNKIIEAPKKLFGLSPKSGESGESSDEKKTLYDTLKEIYNSIYEDIIDPEKIQSSNLSPEDIISKSTRPITPNFIENLEVLNRGRLTPEQQKLLSEKEINPSALKSLTIVKNYENPDFGFEYINKAFDYEKPQNLAYFKNVLKADKAHPESEEKEKKDDYTNLRIPEIKNEKAIRYISENYEIIKSPTISGVLNRYLEFDLKTDSPIEEKTIYKNAFESVYKELMTFPPKDLDQKFTKYMIAKNLKNIILFEEKDLDMIEFLSEKNPKVAEKCLTTWVKTYGSQKIDKELYKEAVDLKDEKTILKQIKILTILQKINAKDLNPLLENIKESLKTEISL